MFGTSKAGVLVKIGELEIMAMSTEGTDLAVVSAFYSAEAKHTIHVITIMCIHMYV